MLKQAGGGTGYRALEKRPNEKIIVDAGTTRLSFKLCLNTSTIRPQPLLEKIRLAAEAGFAAIELWINDLYEHVGRGGEIGDVEKALADHGLEVPSMIALRQWGEATGLEYPLMLDEARRRMELAARIGASYVVATPPREACPEAQLVDRYGELLELGRQVGICTTFEYVSFFGSVSTLDQAVSIVEQVGDDDATLIADAFHTWNSDSNPQLLSTLPAHRVSHYHINDAAPDIPAGQQTDPDRVMIGDGVIDLKTEIAMLRSIGYQGMLSLELFNRQLWQQDPAGVLDLGIKRLRELVENA